MTARETLSTEPLVVALSAREVRVTFAETLSLSQGVLPTARIEVKDGARWKRVDPLLLPPKGQGRSDLMRLLASLVDEGSIAERAS